MQENKISFQHTTRTIAWHYIQSFRGFWTNSSITNTQMQREAMHKDGCSINKIETKVNQKKKKQACNHQMPTEIKTINLHRKVLTQYGKSLQQSINRKLRST